MWTRRPLCTGSWPTWWRPTVLTYSASTIQTYLGEPLTFMSCISNNVSHPYLLCTCIQIRIPNPVSKFVFQIRIRIQKAVEHGINNGSKSCAVVPVFQKRNWSPLFSSVLAPDRCDLFIVVLYRFLWGLLCLEKNSYDLFRMGVALGVKIGPQTGFIFFELLSESFFLKFRPHCIKTCSMIGRIIFRHARYYVT